MVNDRIRGSINTRTAFKIDISVVKFMGSNSFLLPIHQPTYFL